MTSKIIYAQANFCILADNYQWILARYKNKRGSWEGRTYHPSLKQLFETLTADEVRSGSISVNHIAELNSNVDRVYELIESTTKHLDNQLVGDRF